MPSGDNATMRQGMSLVIGIWDMDKRWNTQALEWWQKVIGEEIEATDIICLQ